MAALLLCSSLFKNSITWQSLSKTARHHTPEPFANQFERYHLSLSQVLNPLKGKEIIFLKFKKPPEHSTTFFYWNSHLFLSSSSKKKTKISGTNFRNVWWVKTITHRPSRVNWFQFCLTFGALVWIWLTDLTWDNRWHSELKNKRTYSKIIQKFLEIYWIGS